MSADAKRVFAEVFAIGNMKIDTADAVVYQTIVKNLAGFDRERANESDSLVEVVEEAHGDGFLGSPGEPDDGGMHKR
jgi:hypothetical protein